MTAKEYNRQQQECSSNSCYHCCCNGTPRCFSEELKPIVKDFPARSFKQLTPAEQDKVLKKEEEVR